jgi:hypothetical protein
MSVSSSVISTILICVAVPSVLRWLYSTSPKRQAEQEGASLVFPAGSTIIAVIRWSGVALGTAFLAFIPWTLDNPAGIAIQCSDRSVFPIYEFLLQGDTNSSNGRRNQRPLDLDSKNLHSLVTGEGDRVQQRESGHEGGWDQR